MSINMNKEYRAEIKVLTKAIRQVERQSIAELKAIGREWKVLDRRAAGVEKRRDHARVKISRRIAVLEGRLS